MSSSSETVAKFLILTLMLQITQISLKRKEREKSRKKYNRFKRVKSLTTREHTRARS